MEVIWCIFHGWVVHNNLKRGYQKFISRAVSEFQRANQISRKFIFCPFIWHLHQEKWARNNKRVDKKLSLTISHASSLSYSLCMADPQRNGVMSFVNYVCCYGRQPVKTNSFNQIMDMQALLLNKQNFVIPGLFFLIEVSYERAENELSRYMRFTASCLKLPD